MIFFGSGNEFWNSGLEPVMCSDSELFYSNQRKGTHTKFLSELVFYIHPKNDFFVWIKPLIFLSAASLSHIIPHFHHGENYRHKMHCNYDHFFVDKVLDSKASGPSTTDKVHDSKTSSHWTSSNNSWFFADKVHNSKASSHSISRVARSLMMACKWGCELMDLNDSSILGKSMCPEINWRSLINDLSEDNNNYNDKDQDQSSAPPKSSTSNIAKCGGKRAEKQSTDNCKPRASIKKATEAKVKPPLPWWKNSTISPAASCTPSVVKSNRGHHFVSCLHQFFLGFHEGNRYLHGGLLE